MEPPLSSTSCSSIAWARGSGQRVVAFSFYGTVDSDRHKQRSYYEGVEHNLAALTTHYGQGWTMRLYHNLEPENSLLNDLRQLVSSYPNLDICSVPELPEAVRADAALIAPMTWRFLPSRDPQVDVLLSRDLDSRISEREAAAVQEWLESGRAVHSMRDHFKHKMPMLGGLWGARFTETAIRKKWDSAWQKILNESIDDYGGDQRMLRLYVWPWAKEDAMEHDSYSCNLFPNSIGFPTERKDEPENFVGSIVNFNVKNHLWTVCPEECRRKDHPEWDHC